MTDKPTHHHPETANLIHAPHLEQWAENQREKGDHWYEQRLMQYEDTDLYVWFGRVRNPMGNPFELQGVPFVIRPIVPHTVQPGTEHPDHAITLEIAKYLYNDELIKAVKAYRDHYDCSLFATALSEVRKIEDHMYKGGTDASWSYVKQRIETYLK